MTDERYNQIKARFPDFASTVGYWVRVKLNSEDQDIPCYYAKGMLDGYANAMIDMGKCPDAFAFVNHCEELMKKEGEQND